MMHSGADANKTGFNGKTVLHYAASKGHEELVDYMISDALPYPTLTMLDHSDYSASMTAIACGYSSLGDRIEENLHELRTKLTGDKGKAR